MRRPRWVFRPCDERASRELAGRLRVSPVAAQVLLHRGIDTVDGARQFLSPELRQLHEPWLFRGMARAAERVRAAVERREPILVYGDYDVDGITGTAVLVRLLRLLGADARGFVPERSEGYGMQAERVAAAAREGVRVIVAVDNGTTAFAAIEASRAAGMDVIVADHHLPEHGERMPPAHALLNPHLPGETYPFDALCGAAVAFKLAWAIGAATSPGRRVAPDFREYLLDALALVAIGTVADVVPLTGENRAIVRFGLRALAATRSPGLRALCEAARIEGAPSPSDVAFRLAPRLNAAGRMGEARLALELLTSSDEEAARAIAARLEERNRSRQAVERAVLDEALADAEPALRAAGGRAIVLAREGWHLGVLGIVASRLVDRFYRPAVLISLSGERGRGSARSVPGIALHDALGRCREHLLGFGGHAAAAGVEIRAAQVAAFRERLGAVLGELPEPADAAPPLEIDLALGLPDLSREMVRELASLEPYGRGNEPPLFAARGVLLAAPPRAVGRGAGHLRLLLRENGTVVHAIGFGLGARAASLPEPGRGGRIDVAFRPILSRWGGGESLELEVRDLRAAAGDGEPAPFRIAAAG